MSKSLMLSCVAALIAMAASPSFGSVVLQQTFDNDTVGVLPSGWSYFSGSAATSPNTVVQNGVPATPTPPNVFQNEITDGAQYGVRTSFTPFSLTADSNVFSYEFDLYVDEMVNNFSSGFQFRVWNNFSIISVGDYRLVSFPTAGTFGFSDNSLPIGTFAQDTWHHVKFVIDPSSTDAGVGMLFVNDMNTPIHTEPYSGEFGRTANMQLFDILTHNTQLSRIYIDNFTVAIPEPAGITAIAGLAGATLMRRRRCRCRRRHGC